MKFAEKVKSLRERRGWLQKELADASGITAATISRIESGQVKSLKSEALRRLAQALGTSVDYLVDATDVTTVEQAVKSDPEVKALFRGYEKLTPGGKKQLRDFVKFLEKQEKG